MKNKEDNPLYDAKIQKILNKLISEEVIAHSAVSEIASSTLEKLSFSKEEMPY